MDSIHPSIIPFAVIQGDLDLNLIIKEGKKEVVRKHGGFVWRDSRKPRWEAGKQAEETGGSGGKWEGIIERWNK